MSLFNLFRQSENTNDKPGFYNGKHYTKYVDTVKDLKKDNKNQDAINLLLNLVNAVELEASTENWGPAPWYYEQLAILYRKENKHEDEVEILERYLKACEKYGAPNGAAHHKLVERYNNL